MSIPGIIDQSDDEDETCFERRKPGLPIGLKNLGNTCYVNSFLQIWFHNTQFRKALYSWDPEQDEEEKDNQVCPITQLFICLPFFTNAMTVSFDHSKPLT